MTEENVDLSQFDDLEVKSGEAQECEITHPVTDEKMGIVISVVGKESKTFRTAQRVLQNKRLKRRGAKTTAQQMEDDGIEILAKCTVGWKGVKIGGREIECDFENAKMLYTKYPFIKEQIDVFIGDLSNFTKT